MAGGRLARTLRRDARRRSIFDYPLLYLYLFILLFLHLLLLLFYSSLFPAPCNQQPTRRQATLPASKLQPAIATTTRAAVGGVLLAIRGVLREGRDRHGREDLMDAQEEGKNHQRNDQSHDIKKRGTLIGGNWGLDISRVLYVLYFVEILRGRFVTRIYFICNILKDCIFFSGF